MTTKKTNSRWWALALLCGLQFMLLLDLTVVNIALPRIQESLGFSLSGLAWVVNGYVLMSGGFLLLGGRLADVFGRRRLLLIGVCVFAVSSALCGAAFSQGMMILGRFGQGLAEAIAAPASLGLIALLFTDPSERTKALGIWGGLAALGGTLGYVISGVLTDMVSWRWIFYINLPVTVLVLILLPRLVSESRMDRVKGSRLDVIGAVILTGGLLAFVYGLLQASENPWDSANVAIPVIVGIFLMLVFAIVERRGKNPLIPLTFFANRTRSIVNITTLFFMAAFVSYTFMLTLLEQRVLQYSPLISGLGWLPLGFSIGAGIGLGTALTPRFGVRAIAAIGFVGAGIGLFLTSLVDVNLPYFVGILPGMIVFGIFAGLTMPAATSAALHGVTTQDSGLASGVQNMAQQVGAALGLAVFLTLALRFAQEGVRKGVAPILAVANGYLMTFRVGSVLMIFGGILIFAFFERVDPALRDVKKEILEKS